jgi:uncharacterized protein YukE
MPLNVEIKGQPGEARRVAEYLRGKSQAVHDAAGHAQQAANVAGGWGGHAGPAFQGAMGKTVPAIDDVSKDYIGLCQQLESHAGQLDGAKERMEEALRIAREAGLEVTDKEILDPGPAPAGPMPLPSDKPATPEQQQQHAAGVALQSAYSRKAQAYHECSKVVDDARKAENSALNELITFTDSLIEKSPFSITSTVAGTIGTYAEVASKYRDEAKKIMQGPKVTRSAALMHSPNLSLQQQARAARIHATHATEAMEAERRAAATRMAQWIDRLPASIKNATLQGLGPAKPENIGNKALRLSAKAGGKFPVIGTLITTAGVGYDVYQGKDPVKSAASGYGGQIAGVAATGALIAFTSTPVGWAVGIGVVASFGVGWGISKAFE